MYEVADIVIYPIKSLGGIHLKSAKASHAGFEFDRRWMLLDCNDQFLTQRSIPEMALFSTEISDDYLTIRYKNQKMQFAVEETNGTKVNTSVWEDCAATIEVSYQVNEWFSDQLHQPARLVKIADEVARKHHITKKNQDVYVSLADGYPYMLVGTASLNHLSSKAGFPINMDRFRPNMVISSLSPHEEDDWQNFTIGSAAFENIKPCGRCKIITIDQQTAVINNEPLKTLNTYRKSGNNVIFGTNMICTRPGNITLGDTITLLHASI